MVSESKLKSIKKYNKKTYKHMKLRLIKGDGELIKTAALKRGISKNQYIKDAINERLKEMDMDLLD